MLMAMMNVWIVWMAVSQRSVRVDVAVRFSDGRSRCVFVLMMFVVDVEVIVGHLLMFVQMLVAFTEMKPHPNAHQERGKEHPAGDRFGQKRDRHDRSEKGRGGKVRPRSGRPDVTQR